MFDKVSPLIILLRTLDEKRAVLAQTTGIIVIAKGYIAANRQFEPDLPSMIMRSTQQKRIFTSVRPARVAVLIDQRDEDWQSSCERIIEFFSSTWGGAYNIIVPTDGNAIAERFWKILDVFDPDYLYFYYKTGHDLKINHPDKYEEWLSQEVNKFVAGGPITNLKSTRTQFDELLQDVDFVNEPSSPLQAELIRRLAPLHIGEHAFEKGIAAGSFPDFPLAPITRVLPNSESRPSLMTYKPIHGGFYPLWLASVTGLATDRLMRELIPLNILTSNITPGDYDPFDLLIGNVESRHRMEKGFATPFELSNINCSLYRSTKAYAEDGPIVLVAGETIADFCLYFSLSRLRNTVVWLPQEWLKESRENPESKHTLLADVVRSLIHTGRAMRSKSTYVLMSESLEGSALASLVKDLDEARSFLLVKFANATSLSYSLDDLLKHPLRLYERDNAYRPSSLTVEEGGEIEFFETPKPKNFVRLDPYEHRWISEVNVGTHQLPRNPTLGNWVVRHPLLSTNGARTAKSGISYFCPNSSYFGGDIDTTLVRPTLSIPDAFQVFEHLFKELGYRATLSDKGFYGRDTIRKFGDLPAVGALLRKPGIRALLLKFLDHLKAAPGVHDEGAMLNDKRRYLNFPSIAKLIGSDAATQHTVETLIKVQVLNRGFVFKCRFCRNADWFGLDEVAQGFKCKRCGRSQNISAENYWYSDSEPGWYYKLDEIVYQFLRHHGYVTLLALDHLRRKCEESFLYTPDIELARNGQKVPEMELDILCIRDGVVNLGEAKKENQLGKTKREEIQEIEKYQKLAKQIGAEALVFATFAESWSESTQRYINDTVPKGISVVLLTRSDLLGETTE